MRSFHKLVIRDHWILTLFLSFAVCALSVAARLVEAGKATYKKTVLRISRLPAEAIVEHSNDDHTVGEEVINTVQVSHIPKSLMGEENVLKFFENYQKSGGGKITSLELYDSSSACITFEDPRGRRVQFV